MVNRMSIYYNIQPEDREPVEFTHFDCWTDDTTMEEIVHSWEASLGITLPVDSSTVHTAVVVLVKCLVPPTP